VQNFAENHAKIISLFKFKALSCKNQLGNLAKILKKEKTGFT